MLEKRLGRSVMGIMAELLQAKDREKQAMNVFFSSEFLTGFVWAGLLHEKVNYDDVVDMIPVHKYTEITQMAMEVITQEFGYSAKEADKEAGDVKKNSTESIGTGQMPS